MTIFPIKHKVCVNVSFKHECKVISTSIERITINCKIIDKYLDDVLHVIKKNTYHSPLEYSRSVTNTKWHAPVITLWTLFLTQAGYVKKVLSKFDMLSSKLVYTLMAATIE